MPRPPTHEGPAPFFFVSYSRRDQEAVLECLSLLHARGIHVWWDAGIHAGASFGRQIEERLMSSSAVLVFLSSHSMEHREQNWVLSEVQHAAEQRKEIIPLRLGGAPLPLEWRAMVGHRQIVDFDPADSTAAIDGICARWSACGGVARSGGAQTARRVPAAPAAANPSLGVSSTIMQVVGIDGGLLSTEEARAVIRLSEEGDDSQKSAIAAALSLLKNGSDRATAAVLLRAVLSEAAARGGGPRPVVPPPLPRGTPGNSATGLAWADNILNGLASAFQPAPAASPPPLPAAPTPGNGPVDPARPEVTPPLPGIAASPTSGGDPAPVPASPDALAGASESSRFRLTILALGRTPDLVVDEVASLTKRDAARVRAALERLPLVVGRNLQSQKARSVAERLRAAGADLKIEDEAADK